MTYYRNLLVNFRPFQLAVYLVIALFSCISFSQNENPELQKQIDSIYSWNNNNEITKAIHETEELLKGVSDYNEYDKAVIYTVAGNIYLENNSRLALDYLTKVSEIIDKNNLNEFTPQTKILMASAYSDLFEYEKAFKLYYELIEYDKYPTEKNKNLVLFTARSELVRLNQIICRNGSALDLYVKMFNMELDSVFNDTSHSSNWRQFLALAIANIHGEFGNTDSVNLYLKKYEKEVQISGKDFMKFRTLFNEGNQAYREGDLNKALTKYKKYGSEQFGDYARMPSQLLIKMSSIYLDLNKIDSSIVYLNYIANGPSY